MRPWQFVILIAAALALAVVYDWSPLWILAWSLAAAFTLSLLWLRLSAEGLRFSRSEPNGRAQVGERLEERLALENHSWVPKLWVQVTDGSTLPGRQAGYVSSVGPHQRIAWRVKTLCRQRGRYTIGPVTATTGDPLGLFSRELRLAPERPILVLPQALPLERFDLFPGSMPGRGRGSQRSLQTTTNVVTVRNYVAGDPLTRIHWPTTARVGQFMVKEFDLDPTTDVTLLLDLDPSVQAGQGAESTEEYGVTIAATLASYLLRLHDLAMSLTVNGVREADLALDRGERQLERSLELLAVAHPTTYTPLAEALALEETRIARNSALVVITASTELDWTEGLSYLRRRGVRPVVILLDPQSFDRTHGSNTRAREALLAAGVPVIPITQGEPLTAALERGAA